MKKTLLLFLVVLGIGVPLLAADSGKSINDALLEASKRMETALQNYQNAAMAPGADAAGIARAREEYTAAKQQYEALKKQATIDVTKKSASSVSAPITSSQASNKQISPDEAMNRVISVIKSGRKVTEDDLNMSFAPTEGNSLDLQTGETFWQSVIQDIKSAQKTIHIQMFGMEADEVGWEFAKLLAEKAKEGVEVVLVADRSGARMMGPKNVVSTTEEEKLFKFYRDNGIKVEFYDRMTRGTDIGKKLDFYHFDHRKTFIIDGRTGYIGGYTLQETSRELKHDMMIRAEGPVVREMEAGFLMNYLYNGGKIETTDESALKAKYFPQPAKKGSSNAQLLYNIPRGVHDVSDAYFREIDAAQKYLYVINPYITNDDMIKHLSDAARRGVDVRIVLPGSAENPLNDANTRYHFDELQKAGVKIYLYEGEKKLGKLHAKGLIRDDAFASIGSCNMDTMALRHNYESNLASTDPEFVKKVREELFENDFKVSTLYEPPKSWWQRMKIKVKGGLAGLLDRFS